MVNLLILCLLVFSDGFLLDPSTSLGGNPTSAQTEQHLLGVIDLVVEEKRIRTELQNDLKQLSQSHSQLQNQVITLMQSLNQTNKEEQKMNTEIQKLDTDIQQVRRNQTATESEVKTIQARLHKVYLTACSSAGKSLSSGGVVLFQTKKSSSGINRVSSFTSSGTFTAEEAGLYLISVTIKSRTSGAYYYIYKGSSNVLEVFVGSWYSSTYYGTGTGVISLELSKNETINVKAATSMYVETTESCINIIKIN